MRQLDCHGGGRGRGYQRGLHRDHGAHARRQQPQPQLLHRAHPAVRSAVPVPAGVHGISWWSPISVGQTTGRFDAIRSHTPCFQTFGFPMRPAAPLSGCRATGGAADWCWPSPFLLGSLAWPHHPACMGHGLPSLPSLSLAGRTSLRADCPPVPPGSSCIGVRAVYLQQRGAGCCMLQCILHYTTVHCSGHAACTKLACGVLGIGPIQPVLCHCHQAGPDQNQPELQKTTERFWCSVHMWYPDETVATTEDSRCRFFLRVHVVSFVCELAVVAVTLVKLGSDLSPLEGGAPAGGPSETEIRCSPQPQWREQPFGFARALAARTAFPLPSSMHDRRPCPDTSADVRIMLLCPCICRHAYVRPRPPASIQLPRGGS